MNAHLLHLLVIGFLASFSAFAQDTTSQIPKLETVIAKAEQACVALHQYKKTEEDSFDFLTIAAMGRLADALMIIGEHEKAEKLIALQLPAADAKRLIATSRVKFGAPIPAIPQNLEPAQVRIWKLETSASRILEAVRTNLADKSFAELPLDIAAEFLQRTGKVEFRAGNHKQALKRFEESGGLFDKVESDFFDPTKTKAVLDLHKAKTISALG